MTGAVVGVLFGVLLPCVGMWLTRSVLSVDKIIAAAAQNDEATQ